jgi:hypothetical protein
LSQPKSHGKDETTGEPFGFMVVGNIYKTIGYFVHERIWGRIGWGIEKDAR